MKRSKIIAFSLGPIGTTIFGLVTLPLIAWIFTPENVGRLSLLQITIALAVIFFGLGLDQAYAREFHETENKYSLFKEAATFPLMFFFISMAFLSYASPDGISLLLFDIKSREIGLYVVVCIGASLVTRFLSVYLRLQERAISYSLIQICPKLVFLLVVGAGLVISDEAGLKLLILAQLFASLASLFFAVIMSWGALFNIFTAEFRASKVRPMLSFGGPLVVAALVSWGFFSIDRFMLRGMSTYEQLAVYAVSADLAKGITIFSAIFSTVWWPQVYKWVAASAEMSVIDRISDQVLAVSIVILGLSGLCSWIVAAILPSAYVQVPYLLPGCIAAPLFYLLSEVNVVGINISRRTAYSVLCSIIAVSVNVIGNFFLIPKFGAAGAASSTVAAFLAFLIVRTEISRLLWRKFNRSHIYFWSFVLASVVTSYIFLGEAFGPHFIAAWVLLVLASLYLFRKSFLQIYRFVKSGSMYSIKR
ncbi:MAG: O-antigen/teichoic acid export membrane protein [Alloalcanivorax sp.]|jgi:O-antigen/teichoic acid export membrane protein